MCLTILGGHCHFDFLVHGNHLSLLSPGFLNSIAAHAASLKRMRKWQWVCDKWGFSTLSSMLCLPGFITIFLFTLDCAEHFMNIKQSFGSYVTSSLIRWGFKMWVHLQTRSIIFVYPSTWILYTIPGDLTLRHVYLNPEASLALSHSFWVSELFSMWMVKVLLLKARQFCESNVAVPLWRRAGLTQRENSTSWGSNGGENWCEQKKLNLSTLSNYWTFKVHITGSFRSLLNITFLY